LCAARSLSCFGNVDATSRKNCCDARSVDIDGVDVALEKVRTARDQLAQAHIDRNWRSVKSFVFQ